MSSIVEHPARHAQWGVLVSPGSYDVAPASVALPPSAATTPSSASPAVHASLFAKGADIQVLELPFSRRCLSLRAYSDGDADGASAVEVLLVHARPGDATASSSEGSTEKNRLAGELLYDPCAPPELQKMQRENPETSIRGDAYVFYADADRNFHPSPDWEALHDTLHSARLADLQLSLGSSSRASQPGEDVASPSPQRPNTANRLAAEYRTRYAELVRKREGRQHTKKMDGSDSDAIEESPEGGHESDWMDEEVERRKPRASSGFRDGSGRFGSDEDEPHEHNGRRDTARTDDIVSAEGSEEE